MKQKELEKFITDSEEFIEERSNLVADKVKKDKKYQERYKEYSNLYEELIKKGNEKDIENLAEAIYSLNGVENNYTYLQGFIDGILLRENLAK